MNKKLKRLVVLGAVTIMTASNVVFSNALQVKKVDTSRVRGQIYICVNGKKYKFDINSLCILRPSKPSIDNQLPGSNENENISEENQKPNDTPSDENNDVITEDNNQNVGDDNVNNGESQENNGSQDSDDTIEDNESSNDEQEVEDNVTDSDFSKEQLEVLEIVNKERASNGLKPLTLNKELSKVATVKSQDMVDKGYFDHTSPTYGSPFDMMKAFGISYKTAGENIAKGQKTPTEVMNDWMNSSGHRANILNSKFTELGVGIAKDSNGKLYWTQMFIGK